MQEKTTKVQLSTLPIRLGQFLKVVNVVQDGMEAKIRIQYGEVSVNGEVETRRGKQLQQGDTVSYDGQTWLVDAP